MVESIKIKKYLSEFHDGSLIDIQHTNHDCVFSVESAEMDPVDMKDDIPLSERGTIKGKLYPSNFKNRLLGSFKTSGLNDQKCPSIKQYKGIFDR